jgi:hypothetical protein
MVMTRTSTEGFLQPGSTARSPRTRLRAGFALAALTAATAAAGPAAASASVDNAAQWSGAVLDHRSPLRVESETMAWKCRGDAGSSTCDFEATSRLSNPGTEAAAGIAMFYGVRATPLVVRAGGRELSPASYAARPFNTTADQTAAERQIGPRPEFHRHDVALEVPAGGTVEIVVTGTFKSEPTYRTEDHTDFSGLGGRHPLLATNTHDGNLYGLEYLVSPVASWAPRHRLEVRMRHPSSWQVQGGMSDSRGGGYWEIPLSFARSNVDGGVEERAVSEGPPPPGIRGLLVSFRAELPDRLPLHGGPFVGLGSGFGNAGVERFRMRFGYEIAAPSWLFESLSVDADFRERLVLTPALEATTPHLFFVLPALSVGVGLPIQLLPTATPGVRFQGGLQFVFVGLTGAVDVYPGLKPADGQVQGSVLARFSL